MIMKKKAIIFDMGGVLIDLDMEGCKRAFVENLGFHEIHTILDPCHQKGIIGDLEEGLIDADDFRVYVLERSNPGVQPHQVDEAFWHILLSIAPEKIDLLKRLSGKYDLYMLSNNNPVCLPRSEAMFEAAGFPIYENFKKCYMSFQMKALKPSEKFYKAVVADIPLPAEEMIFVDDSQTNVDGAIAAGLPAVYYKPGTDLARVLADALNDMSIL
jgi:putative hydrolase of the HAD superfamily